MLSLGYCFSKEMPVIHLLSIVSLTWSQQSKGGETCLKMINKLRCLFRRLLGITRMFRRSGLIALEDSVKGVYQEIILKL